MKMVPTSEYTASTLGVPDEVAGAHAEIRKSGTVWGWEGGFYVNGHCCFAVVYGDKGVADTREEAERLAYAAMREGCAKMVEVATEQLGRICPECDGSGVMEYSAEDDRGNTVWVKDTCICEEDAR